ncbi:MAG: DUF2934 domain-containing protein [Methylobacter sp.]|jgi:hypothetical protein|nr:DUF2934 domain-containing protein [Methylobacter sp.]
MKQVMYGLKMSVAVRDVSLNAKELTPISLPDCYTKIAEIAFYKAEKRDFKPGHELNDWLEAEREFVEVITKNVPH